MCWPAHIFTLQLSEKIRRERWELGRNREKIGRGWFRRGTPVFSLIKFELPEIDTHCSASEEGCLPSCPQVGLFVSHRDINKVCCPLFWNNTGSPVLHSELQKVLNTGGRCSIMSDIIQFGGCFLKLLRLPCKGCCYFGILWLWFF